MTTPDTIGSNTSRANWLLMAVLGGLTATYVLAFCLPHRKDMARLEAELRLKRQTSQNMMLAEQIDRVQRRIRDANEYLSKQAARSKNFEPALLFGQMSTLAGQAGVRTTRFEPSAAVTYDKLVQLPLTIHCDGTFAQVNAFLAEIERIPQPLWIDDLRIKPDGGDGESVHCQINLAVFSGKSEISD